MEKKKLIIIILVAAVLLAGIITGVVLFINRDTDTPADEPITEQKEKCPIDFDALKMQNPDVYAYVEVPDTKISYPVLQRENDKEYYSNHTIDGIEGRVPSIV